jgi:AmmeMemoRadiSam system protein B
MVPHAGWRFSGRIAAAVLRRTEIPRTVLVIGPKHTPHGTRWAVAPHARWQLPGGDVASDPELARRLAMRHELVGLEAELLSAARRAVLAARQQGADPEAADHVLRRLDLRAIQRT